MKTRPEFPVCQGPAFSFAFCRALAKPLRAVCQRLAIPAVFCQALANAHAFAADTVTGAFDAPGQTQKVAIVEGPVILRESANSAVRDAYAGKSGELTFSADDPFDLRLHVGDGTPGGYSLLQRYILPLWENHWESWEHNVADATGELRMHGHGIALSSDWKLKGADSLAISHGSDLVAVFTPAGGEAGRILDWTVGSNSTTVICEAIGDNLPTLEAATALNGDDFDWAPVEGTTNRIDASTLAITCIETNPAAFYRVSWPATIPPGLRVFGGVAADALTLGTNTWTELPDLEPYATTNQLADVANAQTNYLPLSGGRLTGTLEVGIGSSAPGTPGLRSLAVGSGSRTIGNDSLTVGTYCYTRGSGNMTAGGGCETAANRTNSIALGHEAKNDHNRTFLWNASGSTKHSTADGRAEFHPAEGAAGFFVDGTNLPTHIDNALATSSENWTFVTTNGTVSRAVVVADGAGTGARRVTDTCTLFWDTSVVSASNEKYVLPTNFPTRRLLVYFDDSAATNITITTAANWDPGREIEIEVVPLCIPNTNNVPVRATFLTFSEKKSTLHGITSATQYRRYLLRFHPDEGQWKILTFALNQYPSTYTLDGTRKYTATIPATAPATVEEWIVLHPEWQGPGGAQSPALQLQSPQNLQPLNVPAGDLMPVDAPLQIDLEEAATLSDIPDEEEEDQ
jgi:hypothetical protein